MNLCTTVTESDVARGKNALKASLIGQLNGMKRAHHCFNVAHTQLISFLTRMVVLQERPLFVTTSAGTSWTTAGVSLWLSGTLASMWVCALSSEFSSGLCFVFYSDFPPRLSFQAVTPKMVRDVCTKYIYDKCPAVAAVGEFFFCPFIFTATSRALVYFL